MGEVYLAHDATLERRVALKLLPARTEADPVARERLRREARAAAALDHPFICKIHEVGESLGQSYIVMEYVEGETLHVLATNGPMPTRQVLDIGHALAQALDEAHKRGLTHRDLKPTNIMVTRQGHVKILDFGLAKQTAPAAKATDSTGHGTALTDPGTRVGTPSYMSPEQILGGSVDPRSDVFSLGVVLHELVSGVHPFLRATPSDTMAAVLRDPPSTAGRDLEAVPGLSAVIRRMLAKACAERFQTMAELRAELQALRERSWLSTSAARSVPTLRPAAKAERTPFVARKAEQAELRRALDQMLVGQGGIVLIGGEPGVGKTRLVRELQNEAHQRGCMTLTGHCYEMEGTPPFMPFVEYMEEAARLVPQAFREALGEVAGEIATIVPSLRRLYPDIPPAAAVPADQQRRLLFNAFLEFLRTASDKSPAVTLFDDLHWADEPTLQLLQHLAPHVGTMRILLVGTYRDVELDVKKPFARTLESLVRQRLARRLSLRRLAESDVEEMLGRVSGAAAPSSVVRVVFQETEGNPFFVEEVYQHLAEEGRLFDGTGAWRRELRSEDLDVPESIRLVIGRRLERLGEEARRVLTAAAVIGRTFPLDLLRAIVEASEDSVLDTMEEAERAHVVTTHPGREVRYGFVHELIRTTLVNGLSLPRRQRLHLRIADAIESLRANSIDAHIAALAHHLYQAGAAADLTRTASALGKAAHSSLASGGFEEALDASENLLSLDLAPDDLLRADALECKGHALIALHRRAEARPVLEDAFATYSRQQDLDGIERTTAALAMSAGWSGDLGFSKQVLLRGLTELPPEARRGRIALRSGLAIVLANRGELQAAHDLLVETEADAVEYGDKALLGRVLGAKSQFYRACGQPGPGGEAATKALELLPVQAAWERVEVEWALALSQYFTGRRVESEAVIERAEKVAERVGHHGVRWVLSMLRTYTRAVQTGDIPAALAYFDTVTNDRWDFYTRVQACVLQLYLGRTDEALNGLREVVRVQPADNYLAGVANANLFAATALTGDAAAARSLWDQASNWLPARACLNPAGRWAALSAAVYGLALLGDRERLADLDPLEQELAGMGIVTDMSPVGPTNPELCAALTAAAAGHVERARQYFERAQQTARTLPNRLLEPNVEFWYGRFAIDQGRAVEGRARLQAAHAGFTAYGMVLHRQLAERDLANTASLKSEV
jgi:tetratricopeptide (TPR) repeat protein